MIKKQSINPKTCAFVLSGGGCFGSFEAGVLEYLIGEAHADFSGLYGISIGAVNAATLAGAARGKPGLAKQLGHLEYLWDRITDFFHPHLGYINAYSINWNGFLSQSLFSAKNLIEYIESILDEKALCNLYANHREFAVGTVSDADGQIHLFRNSNAVLDDEMKRQLVNYVVGSMSLPLVFPPRDISIQGQTHQCFDGGLRESSLLIRALADRRYDDIVVINCGAKNLPFSGRLKGMLQYAERAFDIWNNNNTQSIMDNARTLTRIMRESGQGEMEIFHDGQPMKIKAAKLHIFEPGSDSSAELTFDNELDFDPQKIQLAIQYGKKVAEEVCKKQHLVFGDG
ncbi:MAG: hypothetical protein GY854_20870 [Deltaproteobacteria bacterium]|nr:hypothetical protein [Deltaproteobacteria bacterium]